jgi:hypothetical protein
MVDSTAGKWVKFIDVFLSQIFIKKSFIWRDGDLVRKATYVYLSTGALRYVVVPVPLVLLCATENRNLSNQSNESIDDTDR